MSMMLRSSRSAVSRVAGTLKSALPRLTICLDLDECLLHSVMPMAESTTKGCWLDRPHRAAPGRVRGAPDCELWLPQLRAPARVYLRPGLSAFLTQVRTLGDTILYTSATPLYAHALLSQIDPHGLTFSRLLDRQHCETMRPGVYAKDLRRLHTPLARTILVDDMASAASLQPDNLIEISPFYGDEEDRALPALLALLRVLVDEPDVRPLLRESCGVGARSRRPGACRVTGGGGGIDHCRMGG